MSTGPAHTVAQLNERLGVTGEAEFAEGTGSLPVLRVRHALAEADVYLHGAHVTHFRPAGQKGVLWLSPTSRFQAGEPIRGGIPVCFPWFGRPAGNPDLPSHGFARISEWGAESVESLGPEGVRARFALGPKDATRALWPGEFAAELAVTVGTTLEVCLSVRNAGDSPFAYTEALHSYFAVADVKNVEVKGLAHTEFLDRLSGGRVEQGEAPITFEGEFDRTYVNTTAACELVDRALGRTILIEKTGSGATVVWNPWVEKAKRLGDMPDDGWRTMVCIETANAGGHEVTLAPGEEHQTCAVISVGPTA